MNVLVVEDSETVRGYLQSILSDIPGITVIGYLAIEEDVIECIDTLMPDVVIFDIGLRNAAVVGMLKNIKKRHPGIKVMILADCTSEFYFNRCLYTAQDNFFDKTSQFMRIRAALWAYHLNNKFAAALQPP